MTKAASRETYRKSGHHLDPFHDHSYPVETLAPDLLLHEIRNILVVSERRNRVTADGAASLLMGLRKVPLIIISMKDDLGILQLAREHRLSDYDATYLALAVAQNTALVTLDRKLNTAACGAGLKAFG
ncbi:type II toxin-antitoxin system VapC family toxin [Pararhizobium polonicum]|uniref:type II toxin-antitoxin system VapC family toxin n=1 Tax=Pararhizobium polonicum TaxID=1612624 RepID=UPI001112A3AD|nr:type II toxin-antitoxin system VapC family toxin [Pararhizobium polonicum]